MLNFKEYKDKKSESIQELFNSIVFNLITDIPDSLLCPNNDPDKRADVLIKQAALKAATVSTSLSIPAGFTGVLTSIPDIAAVWRIQAQLVSDIACTYGKFAMLSREAMVWCLFRHSAASLLRDVAVRTGSRIVVQKLSLTALQKLLQKIGVKISANFLGRIALRAIPAIGAIGNGAYTYFDTTEVGKTAMAYFKALEGVEKPELVENSIDKDPDSSESKEESAEKSESDTTDAPEENV
ncbi:EcsC family protein [Fibrobacter sp. UWB12]|uniref:EcsC family protein n=1 Tax=Fibrobacter sp. UWB12 TaxID=1896203 RepID=UPI000911B034|nr:EcsC family protein [Fibrobacter sp. UWB12]SHK21136.1 EcsC protein family protein [Fibrobacter sp. UWB12]